MAKRKGQKTARKAEDKKEKPPGEERKASAQAQEPREEGKKTEGMGRGKGRSRRRPCVPPPESELWPEQCRGERWKPIYAILFAGKCQLCAYATRPSKARRDLDKLAGYPPLLVCTNHPDSPGRLREVLGTETCRNFKAKLWLRPRSKKFVPHSVMPESEDEIRRIPLGHNLFAMVDPADYEELNQHKWCASHKSGRIYALRRTKGGRMVYMHRQIMRASKGTVVDHIDHNTLNNRRCNLRLVTPEQNYANVGPRGSSSGYVGVHRCCNKWEAGITCRGIYHYMGRFDDPVEAARARDRKAYELHGPHAYLNFPEDFDP